MKRLFCLTLALCLLLCACGSDPAPTQDTQPATETTAAPTTAPTTTPAETEPAETEPAETEPAETEPEETEPPVLPASALTGKPLEEVDERRPYAVVINNIKAALPQIGVSQADIVYEILAEGGITRCLAIYSDPSKVEKLGSIRSARPYFIDLAQAYDAILVHAGGSDQAYADLRSTGIDHIDGVQGAYSDQYYYRDQARLNAGYALEHTMFISGPDAVAYAERMGCTFTRPGGVNYGYQFAEDAAAEGENASKVTVTFAGGKTTTMTYNSETNLYSGAQYGSDYIDGGNNQTMTFRNVIVITADTSADAAGYRLFITLTGSGEGWFACGGKLVPIKWSRASVKDPFVYTLEDGTPITLGVGTTYIAVTPKGLTPKFE